MLCLQEINIPFNLILISEDETEGRAVTPSNDGVGQQKDMTVTVESKL